jgi:hypothetical protein
MAPASLTDGRAPSFDGHVYPRAWTTPLVFMDKYGKGGARCMRLR